jgi:hypothetical protein
MPKTLPLLNEDITYSLAKEREVNVLHQLGYYHEQTRFFTHLNNKHAWMKAIVVHHLGLSSISVCHVADMKDWFCGSFNVSVPVIIHGWKGRRQPGHCVLLRFPLPYRVGEKFRRGNGDEKIRCEAGAYAWLQENCPDIPIPQLYGFGLSTGEKVQSYIFFMADTIADSPNTVHPGRQLSFFQTFFSFLASPIIILAWFSRPFVLYPPFEQNVCFSRWRD